MAFKDKYTTADLLLPSTLSPVSATIENDGFTDVDIVPEADKIVLSNDAYAIGEMLEKVINELSFRMGRL